MNFVEAYKQGQAGKNKGLTTGISTLDEAMDGIQRKSIYTLGAGAKTGKCLGKGTKVIMYDLTKKNVEDVVYGDILLGIDGSPNIVTSVTLGKETMYIIHQSKGMSYRVNKSHILSLKERNGNILNITISEYLNRSKRENKFTYGYKETAVKPFIHSIKLDPYFLGLWLGDGSSANCNITNVDEEVLNWLNDFGNTKDYIVRCRDRITYVIKPKKVIIVKDNNGNLLSTHSTIKDVAIKYNLRNEYISRALSKNSIYNKNNLIITRKQSKSITTILREYNLLHNKHIPIDFINNSKDVRLLLLAGLLDSDGSLNKKKNAFEITQKKEKLIRDIEFLANSLGFNTKLTSKISTMRRKDDSIYRCEVFRLTIKGNVDLIPTKVKRKQAEKRKKSVNSIIHIVEDKVDDYYGFTLLNEDKRFFLEDFTVTHNTTLCDYSFVLSPFLENEKRKEKKNIRWIYFSYEIDRIRKEFKYAAFFMYYDFGIDVFKYNGNYYNMSSRYLLGRLIDEHKNIIPVSKEHEEKLKIIYERRIIPLFGEYDEHGIKLKDGVIDFIVEPDNPTGIRNYIMNIATNNGQFVKEKYKIRDNGQIMEKERIVGYKSNDPDEYVIIILDHIRKIRSERGYDMKQKIDKMAEYQVFIRNICGYSFVNIIHLNRNLDAIERMKYNGEYLYPNSSDFKDSGNLSEESDFILTMLNPNDDKYNLKRHLGLDLSNNAYPNYRSLHLIESRDTECPVHLRTEMFGAINIFAPLNVTN